MVAKFLLKIYFQIFSQDVRNRIVYLKQYLVTKPQAVPVCCCFMIGRGLMHILCHGQCKLNFFIPLSLSLSFIHTHFVQKLQCHNILCKIVCVLKLVVRKFDKKKKKAIKKIFWKYYSIFL